MYTPTAGAFGCDIFSYEVAMVNAEGDLRYPEVTRVMVTIVSQNDPPSNPPDVFYYNPPFNRVLMPNVGEAQGQVRLHTTYRPSLSFSVHRGPHQRSSKPIAVCGGWGVAGRSILPVRGRVGAADSAAAAA
jgi:hypothetical protein